MVNRTTAIKMSYELLEALKQEGYQPAKAYLFGSVAKGNQHAHSDIDLAVWDSRFCGCLTIDYEPIKHILSRFPLVEMHTFSSSEDETTNPWITEILSHGIRLDLRSNHHPLNRGGLIPFSRR